MRKPGKTSSWINEKQADYFATGYKRRAAKRRDYYNDQQKGLGRRFAKNAYGFIKRIAGMPQAASFSHSDIRYKVMTDFPFIITYKFDDKTVYIIRVFNTSLHPGRL